MMLNISLDKKDERYSMAEVGQVNPSKFAFALVEGDTVYPLHDAIKCRDFLNDTLVWLEEGFTRPIYGYKYKGPIDTEHTTFHLTFCDQVLKNFKLLNEFEESLGLERTAFYDVEDGSIVSRGDKWWMSSTLHLSWYTQCLRHCNYSLLTLQDSSSEHLINNLKGKYWKIPAALRKLALTIKRNAPSTDSSMHDLNGFYTLMTSGVAIRKQLTYGPQLEAIAPELF
jgi:hypothetical protein